jgi:glyoxylase-like metal-dependent hydrolase (beta-lactamase superfamily II)
MQLTDDDPDRDWTDPGVYTVAPGVHRIPLPLPTDGLRAVNVYAVRTDTGPLLIDSGQALPGSGELLAAALDALGHGPAEVRRFLITHLHHDHYTNAVLVRREHGTPIALAEAERPSLDIAADPGGAPFGAHDARLARAGAATLLDELAAFTRGRGNVYDRSIWERPDEWLHDERPVVEGGRTLLPLHTPGHTRGHLVFVEEAAGLMFTGDHVLPHITPSIGFEAAPVPLPLADYLRSLHRVRALPDRRMLPAHGPAAGGVHARVDALLEHHETRLTTMAKAVSAGASTAFEVARAVPWTRRERRLDDMDLFNRMLAVLEAAVHLDLLVLQERLTACEDGGVAHYS